MAKLPLTVVAVTAKGMALFDVELAYADGTTAHYLVPDSLATVEAVRYSATALAMLADLELRRHPSPRPWARRRRWAS